jgi:hypothetical protein
MRVAEAQKPRNRNRSAARRVPQIWHIFSKQVVIFKGWHGNLPAITAYRLNAAWNRKEFGANQIPETVRVGTAIADDDEKANRRPVATIRTAGALTSACQEFHVKEVHVRAERCEIASKNLLF